MSETPPYAVSAFDAMTSTRTYQKAMSVDRALDRMRELSGVHFEPEVVDALCAVVGAEMTADAAATSAR